ncbi:MAG: PD-(D/E)XK nuclease family protein, partial [Vitreimonas sp.]
LFTEPSTVAHDGAREVLQTLRDLRERASGTTPLLVLTEALERLNARAILAQRGDARGARAWSNMETLLERARGYGVRGLRRFAHDLDRDWQAADNTEEGRPDAEGEAIHIVTMYKAKGLEWPIVIPINATSLPWSPPDYVHRQSDDTLHWVINGIRSPELHASLGADSDAKGRERARVWYVTCTRAKELLIVPNIVEADKRSWFGAAELDLEQKLPEWDIDVFAPTPWPEEGEPDNTQTGADFEREQSAIEAKSTPARWRTPSAGDFDRAPLAELMAAEIADAPTPALVVGAGRLRGLVLHKLMEEVLTGEIGDALITLTERADRLVAELVAQFGARDLPSAQEMAATVLRTLALPEIAALRTKLQPEVALYGDLGTHELLAGRADAIAFADEKAELVLDWKSDVAPDEPTMADHASQLRAYLGATGAPRGGLVYMTTGAVRWVTRDGPHV